MLTGSAVQRLRPVSTDWMHALPTNTGAGAVGSNRPTLDCLRTRNPPKRIKLGPGERERERSRTRRQKRGDNFMPARWMALLPVCLCVAPSDLLLDRPRPPFTALHWLKGIRRNEAKPFLGENVATHRFRRRRRRRPTTAMLAKEKMEENKKIHSAVAEEERSGGEGRGAKGVRARRNCF